MIFVYVREVLVVIFVYLHEVSGNDFCLPEISSKDLCLFT